MSREALTRWGFRFVGGDESFCERMDDGYWTPWHIADAATQQQAEEIERLRQQIALHKFSAWGEQWEQNKALEAEVAALRGLLKEAREYADGDTDCVNRLLARIDAALKCS